MPSSPNILSIADSLLLKLPDLPHETASIYLAMAFGLARFPGVDIRSGSHGYISSELRGYRGADWSLSLVPNKSWVRLYIRSPELARGRITTDAFLADFPAAEITGKGEIALNVDDRQLALETCDWLIAHL